MEKRFVTKRAGIIIDKIRHDQDISGLLRGPNANRQEILIFSDQMREEGTISRGEWVRIRDILESPLPSPFDDGLKIKATISERLDCLLRSVMNSEPNIILMLMLDRQPKLAENIMEHFEIRTDGAWKIERAMPHFNKHMSYIDSAGFVSYRFEQFEFLTEYAASESGFVYGQPLALFSLQMSCKYEIPLYSLFGNPVAFDKNISPLSRFRILELLDKSKEKKVGEIATDTGCTPIVINTYLSTLSELGLVDVHRPPKKDYERTLHCWIDGKNPGDVKPIGRWDYLTTEAAKYLARKGMSTWEDIVEYLRHGEKAIVYKILVRLKKRGFTEILCENDEMASIIEPTAKGREFANEIVCKVKDAVANGTELKAMQESARKYRIYPDSMASEMSDSLRRYLKVLSGRNRKTSKE